MEAGGTGEVEERPRHDRVRSTTAGTTGGDGDARGSSRGRGERGDAERRRARVRRGRPRLVGGKGHGGEPGRKEQVAVLAMGGSGTDRVCGVRCSCAGWGRRGRKRKEREEEKERREKRKGEEEGIFAK